MIVLDTLTKRYGAGPPAVDDVCLEVAAGELLVLIGESGSGKTTTLKMINRLIAPTSGRVVVDGEDTAGLNAVELRRRIGYVFQGIGLFPHYSVGENVAAVPRLLGWTQEDTAARVDELLDLVGLPPQTYRKRVPRALSGGQQQRVGLARALAARPRIMLLDVPFGTLDPVTRDELQREFRRLQHELGLTAILVTHDMTEALLLGDRIAVMQGGKLLQCDAPAALLRAPASDYVQHLVETPKRRADAIEALLQA